MSGRGSGRGGALATHILVVVGGLAALWALTLSSYLLFHTFAEIASVAVAWGLFFVVWNARRFGPNGFFTMLATGYFYVAALDLVHTLTYHGMGIAHDGGNTPTQLWIAARYLEAAILLASFLFLRRPMPAVAAHAGLTAIVGLVIGSIVVVPIFPDSFIPGQGLTTFKVASEYVIIALFLVAAALLYLNRDSFERIVWQSLLASVGLRILSEFAFTAYAGVFDGANMMGHLLKVAGLYLFYRATITASLSRPYEVMFRDLAAAREALRFTEERFRLAIRPAPILAFSQDRELRYDWVFAGEALPPHLPVIGGTDADHLLPADAALLTALKRGVIESGQGVRREIRLGKHRRRAYDFTVVPLKNGRGEVTGLVGTAIEVTDLVRARAEAERANQAKSRFLAAASHDLRQPFQAMRLYHQVLTDSLSSAASRKAAGKLEEAMAAGENLLRALLDVSTIEAGMLQPKLENFPVGEVTRQIAAEIEPQAAEKGLRLRAVHCSGIARSDRTLLARMLRNLAANAVRYTETGGILLGCRHETNNLVLTVSDTGIGIPPEQIDSIFDDFYQVGNLERDREKGLGLGLSIVMRVSKLLDHPIEVRSEPGRGSTFTVRVPLVGTCTDQRTCDALAGN